MPIVRISIAPLLLIGLIANQSSAQGQSPKAPDPDQGLTPLSQALAPKEYDPAPFARGLRAHYKKSIKRHLGVDSLADLPLYQMELELDALTGVLSAQQDFNFVNPWKTPLKDLVFRTLANARHLRDKGERNLRIERVAVNGQPVEPEELSPTSLSVPLAKALGQGERVRVSISYTERIPRLPAHAASAIGMSSPGAMMQQMFSPNVEAGYGILGHQAGIFNLGYFYPVLAARSADGWDTSEPAGMGDMAHFRVANFLVKLVAPQNMIIASSGIQVGGQPQGSGKKSTRETFLLGTALRNFAIQLSTRYEVSEKKVDDIRVRYLHLPEHAKTAEKVLTYATKSIQIYQKLFGPYPWPEFDLAEAPLLGGAGGVEYPGMVTIALALSGGPTGNPNVDLMAQLLQQVNALEFVVAHEVAHQWWHALVGSDSNQHPFMDEALANYSTVLYFEAAHGQAKAAEQVQVQLQMPFQLMRMLGGKDGRVDRPTKAFVNQLEYSALVYGKGALFFHALRGLVGKKRLFAGLRSYARKYSFRQATPVDLRTTLAKASGKTKRVERLYKHWIEESHADKDIGLLDPNNAMAQFMGQLGNLQGFHNTQVQGLDPATMKLFQQAVQQMTGGP